MGWRTAGLNQHNNWHPKTQFRQKQRAGPSADGTEFAAYPSSRVEATHSGVDNGHSYDAQFN